VVLVFRAITERVQAERERRALEHQLRAAQKMEAIGTLAGGIAHDYNNVLGAVMANAALAQVELSADHPASEPLRQIGKAGDRARALVRQILAFSRRQPQELRRQALRPLIEEAVGFLRGMLPSRAQLEVKLADEPMIALVDGTQIEQVLINLCTNAWHSLRGSSGHILIELDAVGREDDSAIPLRFAANRFARLRVTDNGCGMDEATRERIFEPFFTTKPRGQGTGLGLAVAHGIVAEHRGAMSVRSTPDKGSTFSVLLPLLDDAGVPDAPSVVPDVVQPARGDGSHVVYVDDDEVMVVTVQALLKRAGYRVSGFGSGDAALAAISARPNIYDAVVTDFNMPTMSGIDLAAALKRVKPKLPVIISSGYLSGELRSAARRVGVERLLNKEETLERLSRLLGEVLAAGRRKPSESGDA
jgi:nitrogen-specific signal transduction histidine kinase/ActR/RegA family two-component response regulator